MEQEESSQDQPTNTPQEITSQSHALGIILNAIEVAQRRGAFNLDEAELLSRARKLFIKGDSPSDTSTDTSTDKSKELTNEKE